MANPVAGRVSVTTEISTTSELAWKKAQAALQESVKAALEGIDITGVTINAAGLSLVQDTLLIEGAPEEKPKKGKKSKDADSEEESEEEVTEDDDPEAKKSKAKKGKKKGRK